jgi:hypothetical protein
MSDSDTDQRGEELVPRFGVGSIAGLLLFVPVLYVLSIGPVARMAEEGYLPRDSVRPLYSPVIWLHDHTPLQKPLEWYGAMWGWH